MSASSYRRLSRYAALSVVQLLVVLTVVCGGVAADKAAIALVVVSVPIIWAWGLFQADVAMNAFLSETERARWRIAFACAPGSMVLYWHRHVRPRRGSE